MLQTINKGKKGKQETAQIVLKNNGKSITKHLVKDKQTGKFLDSRRIPYDLISAI